MIAAHAPRATRRMHGNQAGPPMPGGSNLRGATMELELAAALALVKAAGFRVSKPGASRRTRKDRVGPTFVAQFADGTVTRMSTYCASDTALDWARGERLARAAYETRCRARIAKPATPADDASTEQWQDYNARVAEWAIAREAAGVFVPAIVASHFERDGVRLGGAEVPALAA